MKSSTRNTLSIYWQHSKRYPWHVFAICMGVLLSTSLDVYKPFLYKNLFNTLALGNTPANVQILFSIAFAILAVATVRTAIWRLLELVNNNFQPRVMSNLLNTCYEYLHLHSYNFFNNSFIGSLVTKARRYQRSFETITDQVFYNIGPTFFTTLFILIVLFLRHFILGFIVLVWSIIFVGFIFIFSRYKLRYDFEMSARDTQVTAQLADSMTNNLNIKLFTGYKREVKSFHAITTKLFEARKKAWDLATVSNAFQGGSMVILEFVMIYVAIVLWRQNKLTIGDFALIQAYLLQIFDQLWGLGRYIRNTYEALADAEEMTQILRTAHEVVDAPGARPLSVTDGHIEFKNISFAYPDQRPIFRNFNLTVEAGERVALIGPSGGGKTTVTKLLFRFFDLQKGSIVIDGQDVATVTQESLRKNLSLVPQEPILFHRSLLENIRYGKPTATQAEVVRAAKLAHCHEFISGFSEQYDTLVGERGVKLSGGERQRVAIARAILKNAPILVLDEATSSLDSESEKLIQDALTNLMRGKTTIVIAHRLSTIMAMDRIVVIEGGKITEQGKHDELLKAEQSTYQRLWEIQAGGFAAPPDPAVVY